MIGRDEQVLRHNTVNEEIMQAILALAALAPKEPKDTTDENALGFCEPPKGGQMLYVDDESGQFYYYKDQQKEFVPQKAIRCKVQKVWLYEKPYKNKFNTKVHVSLMADKEYVLEKNPATNFTRDLLLSLAEAGASINETVVLEISEPLEKQEKVCFCNVHTSGGRIKVEDKSAYKGNDRKYIQQLLDKINKNIVS